MPLITVLHGLQWIPVDLLIQHMHRALKVIYSYRYYNYTDEHSILLKPPILHLVTITPMPHGVYLFMLTFSTKKFFHSSATS